MVSKAAAVRKKTLQRVQNLLKMFKFQHVFMKIDDSAVVETISLQNRLRCIIDDSLMVEDISLFFHRKS